MAPRPIWEGHLRLSLVTCPVRLFKATGEGGAIHFNLLHRESLNRVRQFYRDVEGGEVARADLVRGFQVEKDRYVVVEEEELKALKLESTKVIDIERFVSGEAIDRLYWDQPYFMLPDGKTAQEPYAVIREAMRREGQVALARLVMSSRERIVGIETRGRGLLLSTLRSHDEVKDEAAFFDDLPDVRISPQMIEIARQIIAQQQGPFAPAEFRDRYEEAVRALVEEKAKGRRPVHRPAPEAGESNVIDLMDALRRSLRGAAPAKPGAPGRHAEEAPAPPEGRAKAPGRSGSKPAAARRKAATPPRRRASR